MNLKACAPNFLRRSVVKYPDEEFKAIFKDFFGELLENFSNSVISQRKTHLKSLKWFYFSKDLLDTTTEPPPGFNLMLNPIEN